MLIRASNRNTGIKPSAETKKLSKVLQPRYIIIVNNVESKVLDCYNAILTNLLKLKYLGFDSAQFFFFLYVTMYDCL
jgi:hypothetical protein